MANIKSPFGAAQAVALSATGAQAISIVSNLTVVDGVTTIATGNRTLNLTISTEVAIGARLILKNKTTGTETSVPGTGMTGPTITGVAGKTFMCEYFYDGSTFKPVAAAVQID